MGEVALLQDLFSHMSGGKQKNNRIQVSTLKNSVMDIMGLELSEHLSSGSSTKQKLLQQSQQDEQSTAADLQLQEESKRLDTSLDAAPPKHLPSDLKQRCRLLLVKNREEISHKDRLAAIKRKYTEEPPSFKPAISEQSKKIFNKLLINQGGQDNGVAVHHLEYERRPNAVSSNTKPQSGLYGQQADLGMQKRRNSDFLNLLLPPTL